MTDIAETGTCSICSNKYDRWGNNPAPLCKPRDRCCDRCNNLFVVPVRIGCPLDTDSAVKIAAAINHMSNGAVRQWMFLASIPLGAQ